MRFDVLDLGVIAYDAAWKMQEEFAGEIAAGQRPPTLLLLEHPHVFTFGRRGRPEHLLWTDAQLQDRGVEVRWVDRGGDVTYHGPGQLVGYPLMPLGKIAEKALAESGGQPTNRPLPHADYVGYVRTLEHTIISALARLGVPAGQIPGLSGVWVQPDVHSRCLRCRPEDRRKPAKIAAIGVKVDAQGISRHGFALNVNPDMAYWEGIIACGLADFPVTSLGELMPEAPSMQDAKREITRAFQDAFGGGTPQLEGSARDIGHQ